MHSKITTVLLILVIAVQADLLAQSTNKKDSIHENHIIITPDLVATSTNAIGSSVYVMNDSLAMHTFAGANVMNTLRGNVPNIIFDRNLMNRADLLRTGQPLIIDGIVYNGLISNYYNLNTFEYKNVYAFTNGGSLLHYGDPVASGGIFLESKTGRDVTKPTFEWNSYSTYGWETTDEYTSVGSTGSGELISRFSFGNSFAYMQDFGVVDTRVSYNYTIDPNDNFVHQSRKGNHNLKVNTGFDIGKRFTARIIFDQYHEKQFSNPQIEDVYHSEGEETEIIQRGTHTNLVLRYQALDWLMITSQSAISRVELNEEEQDMYQNEDGTVEHKKMANIFITASKQISPRFSISGFTGFQTSLNEYDPSGFFGFSENEYTRNSIFFGTVFDYNKTIYTNLNLRKTHNNSTLPDYGYDSQPYLNDPAYSVTTAWVFTNSLALDKSILPFGKLRVMVAGQPFNYVFEYPRRDVPQNMDGWQTTAELGIDISFFDNKLFFSPTTRIVKQDIEYGGFNQFSIKTWELVVGGSPVSQENFQWTMKGIWGKIDMQRRTGYNLGVGVGPDWRASLLNQFQFSDFFITLLIDGVRGESYNDEDFNGRFIDETQFRLRDLSIGHNWKSGNGNRGTISLSGRNLFRIYSESDKNIDGYTSGYTGNALRSVSLSLSLMF